MAGTELEHGLTTAEARARLVRDGANEVPEMQRHPLVRLGKKFWGASARMIELIIAISWTFTGTPIC